MNSAPKFLPSGEAVNPRRHKPQKHNSHATAYALVRSRTSWVMSYTEAYFLKMMVSSAVLKYQKQRNRKR